MTRIYRAPFSLRPRAGWYRPGRRGFTAVEITMVATVIAILALLVLPIFRDRVEAARLAAAQDELDSIAKAILMVEADVGAGFQPRLQDLDNGPSLLANGNVTRVDIEPPIAAWNWTLETAEQPFSRQRVVSGWKGPYLSFKRFAYVSTDPALNPNLDDRWWLTTGNVLVVGAAGIPNFTGFGGPATDDLTPGSEEEADRYPIDPWGSPYLFFGKGRFDPSTAATGLPINAGDNYEYPSARLYCLGPNGVPGNSATAPLTVADEYRREGPFLGTGDDLDYRF